jgi:hypothetical protein
MSFATTRVTIANAAIMDAARLRNAILGDSLNTIPLYLFKLLLHDNLQRA